MRLPVRLFLIGCVLVTSACSENVAAAETEVALFGKTLSFTQPQGVERIANQNSTSVLMARSRSIDAGPI